MSVHQGKAGSDLIGEERFSEEVFLRGGGCGAGFPPVLLGERQDAGAGGGDVGLPGQVVPVALLVGEARLKPALDLRVGEAEVAGGLPHLAHHKHLLVLAEV